MHHSNRDLCLVHWPNLRYFYLVANPYTAPVSVKAILDASSNLSNAVTYYDPTKGTSLPTPTEAELRSKQGGYLPPVDLSGVTVGDANDVVLPPMGAIFVMASAVGTINIPTGAIYTGSFSNDYAHKTANTKEVARAALTALLMSALLGSAPTTLTSVPIV